jgi:hypothetical protein
LRNRPVDQVDRRNPDAFAELLELGDAQDVVEPVVVTAERGCPVEFLLGIDRQQRTLAETGRKAGPLRW